MGKNALCGEAQTVIKQVVVITGKHQCGNAYVHNHEKPGHNFGNLYMAVMHHKKEQTQHNKGFAKVFHLDTHQCRFHGSRRNLHQVADKIQ